jgi:hypothetical protein
MNNMIVILNRFKVLKTNLSLQGWPPAIELPSSIHNGLAVQPKDYEAPPLSHIPTLSRGGGDSRL